ncbi:pilus assembly protein TadG-related protein [Billgrantia sp. C5P2]|uniref:pilus assembly protein TadG-related protein n=1 Tax=Billgrantia sp. C5P2 TaxID=3436239 RepID=UPI003DA5FF70
MNASIARRGHYGSPQRQRGVSIVLLAVGLFMLLAFTALAVDGGNLYVARNELHNAADAGSLAGARHLYLKDGSWVNDGTRPYDPSDPDSPFKSAEAWATEAAMDNWSQNEAVEVLSAERGHWSFATRSFTPNPSIDPVDLFERTAEDLDGDPNFINAVEVVTARQQTQVEAFFGRIFGFEGYDVSARSVAYIGFAGNLRPEDVDQPIALCRQALMDPSGNYSCSTGRFIPEGDQTGGWTNFQHDQSGASNANELRNLVCGDGNPDEMRFGEDISTNNGQVQSAFSELYDCWVEKTAKEEVWTLTLPVIDCEEGVAPSNRLVGAVTVNIVWIIDQANNIDNRAPRQMELPPEDSGGDSPGTWSHDGASGAERWDSFVDAFDLQKENGDPAHWSSDPQQSGWRQKSIYFLPSCSYHDPKGQTGGENFGILAQIPVLVD